MPKFNEFMKKLVENKFYIWCVRGFNQKVMFNDYILPTAIYLYYMHVDLNQINKIHLYIVNDKTYKTYRGNVGGEYTDGLNRKTNKQTHIILVKQSNNNTPITKDESLNSLFHELTHLVDNIDFNGLSDPHIIDYYLRWHEIRARILSRVFSEFYKRLLNNDHLLYNTLVGIEITLDGITDDLMHDINVSYYNIDTKFDYRYLLNVEIDNTQLLSENIQLLTSMREVHSLKNFVNNIEERL